MRLRPLDFGILQVLWCALTFINGGTDNASSVKLAELPSHLVPRVDVARI
jgi:hypothetical protein